MNKWTPSPRSVSVELPPGWRAINPRGLLAALLTGAGQSALSTGTNADFAGELVEVVPPVLAGFDEAGLLLGGFRERPGHLDLLTIALPPTDVQGDHPPPEARSAEEGTWVDLTENFAIEHTGIDQPSDGSIIGSSVQLVIIVPGSHQGAVITAQSTESGVEADLETSARYVADSMRLLPAVPTS